MAIEPTTENTLNVQRWRILEVTDPQALRLIEKIQCLQNKTINMQGQIILKNDKIEEVSRLLKDLSTKMNQEFK